MANHMANPLGSIRVVFQSHDSKGSKCHHMHIF
ncbi:hypothetical protein CHELA40_14532 [Chelatococcus asaccharovorans]|nr:hypothetical protein CHELA17_61089 [Chelatococcus asaccharovorans]CAH1678188.1 hypothetical protein CHELA40_14532 [Chelatococcus asaccharovorans]